MICPNIATNPFTPTPCSPTLFCNRQRDDPFDGLEVDDYQQELLAAATRERTKHLHPTATTTAASSNSVTISNEDGSGSGVRVFSMGAPPPIPSMPPGRAIRGAAFATAVASLPPPPPPPTTATTSATTSANGDTIGGRGVNLGGIMEMEVEGGSGNLEEARGNEVSREVTMKKESCKVSAS
jgi:hypothetical protein